MQALTKTTISKTPAIISIIALILTFLDWNSYGYYTLMKFIVTGTMIYYAYQINETLKEQDFWFWTPVGIAILFNPIIPIHLGDKGLWMIIDIVVIGFLITLITKIKNY